jgi:hypothetical protein
MRGTLDPWRPQALGWARHTPLLSDLQTLVIPSLSGVELAGLGLRGRGCKQDTE